MPKSKMMSDEKLLDLLQPIHDEVVERHAQEKQQLLHKALKESRDDVLKQAPKRKERHFSRPLPTSGQATTVSHLLLCQPCQEDSNTASRGETNTVALNEKVGDSTTIEDAAAKQDGQATAHDATATINPIVSTISVTFQTPHRHERWTTVLPAIPLEGAHDARPEGTTPAFLKSSFASEDEKTLTYVPYFGDDDNEDLYSELYNTEGRERMVEFGAEYRQTEMYRVIDETLELANERLGGGNISRKRMEATLASMLKLDVDLVHNRHDTEEVPPTPCGPSRKSGRYEDAVDSYRQCFCRRCFTYDCNMHGCQKKPNLQIQGELAMEKERSGFWKIDGVADENETTAAASSEEPPQPSKKRQLDTAVAQLDVDNVDMTELTPSQKSICERTFLIHQGDIDKIALTLGAPRQLVQDYVTSQGMNLDDYIHIRPNAEQETKKRKADNKSMKSYNAAWLKRVEDAEIHPFFAPCDHPGPCSEENCSCIKNRFFCTKHCVNGPKSRNFFRGCNCRGNKCSTKSCACYAAKRECDPDLCRNCGTCSDPPGKRATSQLCRNDNISMRRHAHVLLAKSTVEKAGWGLFTKHALKRGDFIHEYVGEVISQEEAERRGVVCDKMNRSYLFNLSSDLVIDAARKGNKTRFVNHSSDRPNCEIKMTWVNGDIHIGLFASCDIDPQSELFFDYRYNVGLENDLIVKPAISVDWMKNGA